MSASHGKFLSRNLKRNWTRIPMSVNILQKKVLEKFSFEPLCRIFERSVEFIPYSSFWNIHCIKCSLQISLSSLYAETALLHSLEERQIIDLSSPESIPQHSRPLGQFKRDDSKQHEEDRHQNAVAPSIWALHKIREDTQLKFLRLFCHDAVKEMDITREVDSGIQKFKNF